MRLIGISRLLKITAADDLRGTISAFHAELVTAKWETFDSVLAAFPKAERRRHRLVVDLDERHCVVLAINVEAGIAVVEFAGPRAKLPDTRKGNGGRPK